MTTLDLVPDTFYVPGLNFRGQADNGMVGVICSNALGAVEVCWDAGEGFGATNGMVIVHSPTLKPGWACDHTSDCSTLGGGTCFATSSTQAYRDAFRDLLTAGDVRGVCTALARWHDDHFRPVTP